MKQTQYIEQHKAYILRSLATSSDLTLQTTNTMTSIIILKMHKLDMSDTGAGDVDTMLDTDQQWRKNQSYYKCNTNYNEYPHNCDKEQRMQQHLVYGHLFVAHILQHHHHHHYHHILPYQYV